MDKTTLYKKLDIDKPEEFKFYENLSALLEEDDYIEENLIKDLIKEIDKNHLAEHMDSYFEDFLKNIPDEETDLYITVDSVGRALSGMINEDMAPEDIDCLAEELLRFRKWYVQDLNVFDKINGVDINVRDARFNIVAAGFLGEKYSYDFRNACDYSIEGYNVRLSDIIAEELDDDEFEGFREFDSDSADEFIN